MNSKEISQAVKRYIATGKNSVGIEYTINKQPIQIQTKFWNQVRRAEAK